MKLLTDRNYDALVAEAREAVALRGAVADLLRNKDNLEATARALTKQFARGEAVVTAMGARQEALVRQLHQLASTNVKLAQHAEWFEAVAHDAVGQSEAAVRAVAKEYGRANEATEMAELLAETLEVVLDNPDRLEECGRNSLVAYRHLRMEATAE